MWGASAWSNIQDNEGETLPAVLSLSIAPYSSRTGEIVENTRTTCSSSSSRLRWKCLKTQLIIMLSTQPQMVTTATAAAEAVTITCWIMTTPPQMPQSFKIFQDNQEYLMSAFYHLLVLMRLQNLEVSYWLCLSQVVSGCCQIAKTHNCAFYIS